MAVPALPSADLPALIARARAQRTELATLVPSQDEIDAEITLLNREVIPSPTLFVDVQRDLPGQIFVGGGLALPLPLWRRNQGPLALARAERTRLDDERALIDRDVALEVERAFQTEGAQREMVQLLDHEVLPAAEAATTLMTEGWRAGKFDLVSTAPDGARCERGTPAVLGNARVALGVHDCPRSGRRCAMTKRKTLVAAGVAMVGVIAAVLVFRDGRSFGSAAEAPPAGGRRRRRPARCRWLPPRAPGTR